MTQDPETFDQSQKPTFDDKKVTIDITFTGTDCYNSVTTKRSNTPDSDTESLVKPTLPEDLKVAIVDIIRSSKEKKHLYAFLLALIFTFMSYVMVKLIVSNPELVLRRLNKSIMSCRFPDGSCIDYSGVSYSNTLDCSEKRGKIDFLSCATEIEESYIFGSCTFSSGECKNVSDVMDIMHCNAVYGNFNLIPCKSISKRSSCVYWGSQCYKSHCKQRLLCDETSREECEEMKGVFNTESCPVQ